MRQPGFPRGLKFVSHRWMLLHQYVIAAGFTNAALHGYLVGVLRQQKTCGKQKCECETRPSHRVILAEWDGKIIAKVGFELPTHLTCVSW